MLNGRKNAVIGFGALCAFVLLESMAVPPAGVAVFLDVVLDIDLPVDFPGLREVGGSAGNAFSQSGSRPGAPEKPLEGIQFLM